jgi:hypothetical protein
MAEVSFEVEEQTAAEILNVGGDNNVYMGERRRGAGVGRALAMVGLTASFAGLALLAVAGIKTAHGVPPANHDWGDWRSYVATGWLTAAAIAILAGLAVGKVGRVLASR